MDAEGFSFHLSPLSLWLAHCCHKTQAAGGSPVPLMLYRAQQAAAEAELSAAVSPAAPADAAALLDAMLKK